MAKNQNMKRAQTKKEAQKSSLWGPLFSFDLNQDLITALVCTFRSHPTEFSVIPMHELKVKSRRGK